MKITAEKAGKAEIKLTVELTELEMQDYYRKTLEKLGSQINVKGFRPGKIPPEVVEQQVEKPYIMAQAVEMAIAPTYMEAIKQEKIEPIAQPKVKILADSPLKYEAIIPVYPEVKVKDLKKIKLERKKIEVTEADIDAEVKHFQTYHATYADVDRAAASGDRVEIDFQGTDEGGAPLEGTVSKNHPMILGEKTFVPGFEENLVGMNKGEEKEFSVTFPTDYFHKPFQNKPVKFKVKLNRIEERHLPALDGEFIKKLTGKELSEAEFRAEIRVNLLKHREQEEGSRLETELLEKIRDNTEVDLAEGLVDEEIHYILDELKSNAASRGIDWNDYLKATNKSEHDLHEAKKTEAEGRLRLRFGVQELFKQEKIEVTDQELEQSFQDEMKILASMNYQPKIEDGENIKARLRNKLKLEKLIALFVK
jgi:trigger factor